MNILKTGKKQDISNLNLANQEGNENIKMFKIENLVLILLCSDLGRRVLLEVLLKLDCVEQQTAWLEDLGRE